MTEPKKKRSRSPRKNTGRPTSTNRVKTRQQTRKSNSLETNKENDVESDSANTSSETIDSNVSNDSDDIQKDNNSSKRSDSFNAKVRFTDSVIKEPSKSISTEAHLSLSNSLQEKVSSCDSHIDRGTFQTTEVESDFDESFSDNANENLKENTTFLNANHFTGEKSISEQHLWIKKAFKIAFGFAVIAVLFSNVDKFAASVSKDDRNRVEQFQSDFKEMKSNFPNQDKRLWKISKLALEKNLKSEDNKEPAVLMLASTEKSYATAQCLARKLSQGFSARCNDTSSLEVNGMRLQNLDGDSAKVEVDSVLEKGFRNGACSATILRFESMPAFATTTFYQYCENDNAPFKNAAIIFTIQIKNGEWNVDNYNLTNLSNKKWDLVVGEFLTSTLKKKGDHRMKDEMIAGLLSRITPSVVWVESEDSLQNC